MKKPLIFLLITLSFNSNLFSQSWNKNDRENVYNECLSGLGKYQNISKEQKESLCICYLNEVTKASKTVYDNMIEIELKKFRETSITQCTKNLGIDLTETKIEEPKAKPETSWNISRDAILGHWKDDESEFWLEDSGNYTINYNNSSKKVKGSWTLSGTVLSLQRDKALGLIKTEKSFNILMFTPDQFVFETVSGSGKAHNAIRIKKQ